MAQEPQSSRNQKELQPLNQRQVQQNLQHDDPDDEVSEEIVPLPYRKAYEMAESFAATRIGQFFMNRGDSLLKIVEMTAKWSLPRAQQDDKLHRPLPWIPFLVLIISLRLARVWISVGALMIGNAPVKAEDVVYFIQTRRRKLRYLRLQGVKQFNENSSKISAGYRQSNLMSQLKILLSRAFCSPGKQRPTESHKIYFVSNPQTPPNSSSDQQAAKRPRADVDVDDDADANLSVQQMLERYANENVNADDDPDFVPEENEATETSSASSESDSDDEVAESEQNSNGKMETTMPVPIIEIKKEIINEMETLPENGPTNGGEHRTTSDVAHKFVTSRPNGHDFHNLQNPTTHKQTTLNATSAAAISEALLTAIATLEASSEGAFSLDSTELSLTKLNFPHTTDSSPTLSAVSSTSSIETFIVRNEIVNKDQEISTATSPTPSSKSDEKQLDDFATPSLTSISSSEDDFYSPIGSPPDFNALQQESLKTPSQDTSAPHNLEPKVAEENPCATLDANRRTKNQRQVADHSSKHSHGHNQGHGHGNGGSQHHQIYKGRLNRQQHFEK